MILAIDTTDRERISVSLRQGKKTIAILTDNNKFGSQVLLPTIIKLLKKQKIDFKDLAGIEVNRGPGSFTGIKVGAAVANALGYSLNIPVNSKKLETEFQY
jgi:tRNA threonylcarbamoyladenosine biosynthesis protein TsaB